MNSTIAQSTTSREKVAEHNSRTSSLIQADRTILWRRFREKSIHYFFLLNGIFSIIILIGIFSLLFTQGLPALKEIGLTEFFLRSQWDPTSPEHETYGLLAMIVSTLIVTIGALTIAVPLGIAAAAYLADVAHHRVREIVKPVIEILAGIPSVVVGFLGIILVGPLLAKLFGTSNGLNAINGSILLAVMSLPTIISISEDAILSVPQEFKNASLALGATRWQTLVRVTIPAALSGIIAAVMLGMGRAIGETMTVLMACGNAPAFPHSFLDSVRTMTATIAIELGETVQGYIHYRALFVIGFVLFIMTFLVNLVSDLVLQKYQKVQQ
ncbi:phosphate ABC transporter permease subunit PstC [candidate division KSB1 bacterium]|nr:phosphate ABC transporter permease subunit PstC [candidate division KSB1 bacterium]